MDRDELTRRLFATFLEELKEHVRAFNHELLELEQHEDDSARRESIRTLFRIAHTLKGAARSANSVSLEGACHKLEELLGQVRAASRPLNPDLFQLLFACADAIARVGNLLAEDRTAPQASLLAPILARLASTLAQPVVVPVARLPSIYPEPIPLRSMAPPSEPGLATLPPLDVSNMVRVPGAQLDALLAQSGELLVARRRLDARHDQMNVLLDLVIRWRTDLVGADRDLKRWMRKEIATNGSAAGPDRPARAGPPRRLERVVGRTGDLLRHLEKDLEKLTASFADDRHAIDRAAAPLEDQIRRARMLPFSEACEGLARAARDLSLSQHKDVEFVVAGGSTELDRSLVDGLRGPLLHLVRNAIDHGIESPGERARCDKPRRAKVVVAASVRGDRIEIFVEDDGRGIDWERVRKEAAERDILLDEAESEPVRLLFSPGFSTAPMITEVSGRGVGLDIVKTEIEYMRGSVDVSSDPAMGTRFTLTLPLTVTSMRALFVRAGGEVLALPSASIRRLLRVEQRALSVVHGKESVLLGGPPVPVASLARTLGLPAPPLGGSEKISLLVLGPGRNMVALAVDEYLAEQDVVLKPLGARLQGLRFLSGAAVLPSGKVALFLNPATLVESVRVAIHPLPSGAAGAPARSGRKRLILADDSVTTRTLEKSILEAAGYEVLTAADGSLAWQLLQEQGANAIVSDVEMPNMDGFALTQAIRGSKRFRDLPVILLTALETDQGRTRGLEIGADAYLKKSAFDQRTLLATIEQLV